VSTGVRTRNEREALSGCQMSIRRFTAIAVFAVVTSLPGDLSGQRGIVSDTWVSNEAASVQQVKPQFTIPQRIFNPGETVSIDGENLAPQDCALTTHLQGQPYPVIICGAEVNVGGVRARLVSVAARQIQFTVPENLLGASTRACIHGVCIVNVEVCVGVFCSELVSLRSSTALLRVQGSAYAHMPIWVNVELPNPYKLSYPCRISPWDFHGLAWDGYREADDYQMEARHNGALVVPPSKPVTWDLLLPQCMSGLGFESRPSRFPLHLAYRLEPGFYSIRLTAYRRSEIIIQSAWTDIEVKPCPPETRREWLRSITESAKSAGARDVIWDIVPSLLAAPDTEALSALVPVYSAWLSRKRLVNMDIFVFGFLRNSLAAFDDHDLRQIVPANRLREWCPPQGRRKNATIR
jgi:hypothetical protein